MNHASRERRSCAAALVFASPRPDRPHRRGDRRPCHHPARCRRAAARRRRGEEPRNRHPAQGRHRAVDRARAGLGPELADAVARPATNRSCGSSRSSSSANCPRTSTAGRRVSGAASRPIPRSAISSSAPARTNSPRPMPATPTPRSASATSSRTPPSRRWSRSTNCWASISPCSAPPAPANPARWRSSCSRILEKNPQAHILLLDVHREYAPVLPRHPPRSSRPTT